VSAASIAADRRRLRAGEVLGGRAGARLVHDAKRAGFITWAGGPSRQSLPPTVDHLFQSPFVRGDWFRRAMHGRGSTFDRRPGPLVLSSLLGFLRHPAYAGLDLLAIAQLPEAVTRMWDPQATLLAGVDGPLARAVASVRGTRPGAWIVIWAEDTAVVVAPRAWLSAHPADAAAMLHNQHEDIDDGAVVRTLLELVGRRRRGPFRSAVEPSLFDRLERQPTAGGNPD
jgi:hypothetical protein